MTNLFLNVVLPILVGASLLVIFLCVSWAAEAYLPAHPNMAYLIVGAILGSYVLGRAVLR